MKRSVIGAVFVVLVCAPGAGAQVECGNVRLVIEGTSVKVVAGNDPGDEMVRVGPLCVDKYEASVWDSLSGGSQITAAACSADGNDCTNIFARSVEGVPPAEDITWFQAQQACANAGKRLLTNAEWQMAAAGTPDSTSCNVSSSSPSDTGAFPSCVSNHGVHDMVGNLWEWVADWVPLSTACPGWAFSDDSMCLAGASTTSGPGALVRGGDFNDGAVAGVFAVTGGSQPSAAFGSFGFRCAR